MAMLESIRDALINHENIIPVIGYEMLPIRDVQGNLVPYLHYISKLIFDTYDLDKIDVNGSVNFGEPGFVIFNQVMHLLLKNNSFDYKVTITQLSDFAMQIHPLVDTTYLEKIVKIQSFSYFFNLTFTTHLAELVTRFRSFPNVSLKQSMFPFNFKSPKRPDDLIKNDCSFEGVIYNIAGLAYSNGNRLYNFFYSDDDFLDAIPQFNKRYDIDLNNYREVVNDSSLLFLGCQYPDWLTRILISTFKPGIIKNTSAVQARIYFDYCNDNSNSFFLSKHQFTFQSNVITTGLVNDLYTYLEEDDDAFIQGNRNKDFIFISYTRDNLALVKNIVCQLSTERNVWFDRIKLFPGSLINEEVKLAIQNCKLFLPIITHEAIRHERNDYVRQEWIYYAENFADQLKVIPLVHKNVNLGELGFQIGPEFATPGNLFYITVDESGLLQQDITNIINRV
jgi:hypothetical protein